MKLVALSRTALAASLSRNSISTRAFYAMATQQNERVLVVGAGIAGSVLAYHLARANFNVTVIERSRREQKLGQGLEIQEPALKIVKAMGIFNALDANKTSETGFILENEKSQARGKFGLDGPSPTGVFLFPLSPR